MKWWADRIFMTWQNKANQQLKEENNRLSCVWKSKWKGPKRKKAKRQKEGFKLGKSKTQKNLFCFVDSQYSKEKRNHFLHNKQRERGTKNKEGIPSRRVNGQHIRNRVKSRGSSEKNGQRGTNPSKGEGQARCPSPQPILDSSQYCSRGTINTAVTHRLGNDRNVQKGSCRCMFRG